jgi:hypothetical protein
MQYKGGAGRWSSSLAEIRRSHYPLAQLVGGQQLELVTRPLERQRYQNGSTGQGKKAAD